MNQFFEYFYAKESVANNMHRAFAPSQKHIIIQNCMMIVEKP